MKFFKKYLMILIYSLQLCAMESGKTLDQVNGSKSLTFDNSNNAYLSLLDLFDSLQTPRKLISEFKNASGINLKNLSPICERLQIFLFEGLLKEIIDPLQILEYYNKYNSNPALHNAVMQNELVHVFGLLVNNPDLLNQKNNENKYALELAVKDQNFKLIVFIMSLKDLPSKLLIQACANKNYQFCKHAINIGADVNYLNGAALSLTFDKNYLNLSKLLISKNANIECLKYNPLFYKQALAIINGFKLLKSVKEKNIENIKQIMESETILDCQDDLGNTALHYAVSFNDIKLIELLLNLDHKLAFIKNFKNINPYDQAFKNKQNDVIKKFHNIIDEKNKKQEIQESKSSNKNSQNGKCTTS